MTKIKNNSLSKLLAGVLTVSMIFSFLAVAVPPVLADDGDEIVLTITGDGVGKTVEFTMEELRSFQEIHHYSGYNFYPSLCVFRDTPGVPLQTLLDLAELDEDATMIKIKTGGTSYSYYTKGDLLDMKRYYFPQGEESGGDCSVWPPEGRGRVGAEEVPTMIAFIKGGKLIYGQQTPLEPTCCQGEQIEGLLRNGCTIEVSIEDLKRWDKPDASPAPGSVPPGTEVELQYGDGSLWHTKIYYTLDGSEPGVESNIYNISYPTFRPQLNKPIPVTGDITIKTRAIGLGKSDSDVAVYDYNLGTLACTVKGAGIKNDYTVETLRSMTGQTETYQCKDDEGQSTSVSATGVLLSNLLNKLGAASNWEVKFITVSGEEYDGGTVKDLQDQNCMLAYEIDGKEISDVSGDETVKIQILRHITDLNASRLKHVNTIKLINVDDEITIDDVQLLDYKGDSVNSAAPGGGYGIEVDTVNAIDTAKEALLLIQVRCGQDAGQTEGGRVVACTAVQTVIDMDGSKCRAEFNLPVDAAGKAFVDVFVWDNIREGKPLGSDDHTLSFDIK